MRGLRREQEWARTWLNGPLLGFGSWLQLPSNPCVPLLFWPCTHGLVADACLQRTFPLSVPLLLSPFTHLLVADECFRCDVGGGAAAVEGEGGAAVIILHSRQTKV